MSGWFSEMGLSLQKILAFFGATDILGLANGGTNAATAQAAINNLTNVSAATNEHVLTKDTATGNASFKAAAGGAKALIQSAANFSIGASSTNYTWLYGGAGTPETTYQVPVPLAGTFKNFYVRTTSTQSGTGSLVITMRKNGVDTTIIVTVAAGASAGTVSDTTHSFTVAAGDLITMSIVNNATVSAANLSGYSIEFDPT